MHNFISSEIHLVWTRHAQHSIRRSFTKHIAARRMSYVLYAIINDYRHIPLVSISFRRPHICERNHLIISLTSPWIGDGYYISITFIVDIFTPTRRLRAYRRPEGFNSRIGPAFLRKWHSLKSHTNKPESARTHQGWTRRRIYYICSCVPFSPLVISRPSERLNDSTCSNYNAATWDSGLGKTRARVFFESVVPSRDDFELTRFLSTWISFECTQ